MYVSQITNNGPIQNHKVPELYAKKTMRNFFSDQMNREYVYRYNGSDQFFVYSPTVPKVPSGESWSVQSIQFNPQFEAGNKFSFCCRINTAKRENDKAIPQIKKGRECGRSPVDSVNKVFKDLAGKAFLVENLSIEEINVVSFVKADGNPVTIESADVTGTLTVVDPSEFIKVLTKGVGREKCYGYGMILLN